MDCDFQQTPFKQTTYIILPRDGRPCDVSAHPTRAFRSAVVGLTDRQHLGSPCPALSTMPAFPIPTTLPQSMTPILQTLQHFDTATYRSMGSTMGQSIVKACIYTIAIETPHLTHALHAVAATHLSHLLPAAQHPIQHNQNKLAAAYHWQRCLQLFRAELQAGATRQNMDALISTVMLISTHQFMLPDFYSDLSKSFVYAPAHQREACLAWLFINSGFQAVWRALGDNAEHSLWMPVLQDADIQSCKPQVLMQPSGDETHYLFLELCEIDACSTADESPYYNALESLLFLRQLSPDGNLFNKLINFLGGIDSRYHRLLVLRDKRALIILAHWLALMCEIQQWWIIGRCKAECLAITTFLMHDRDWRVLKLLEYPARMAGIATEIP